MQETITLSDLKREELEVFVEFCYAGGSMPFEKLRKHAMSLYRESDKYDIPYLRDFCRNQLMLSTNATEILELSKVPLDETLHDFATNYIASHLRMSFPLDKFRNFK